MNQVSTSDVAFFSLAVADFTAAATAVVNHDYLTAIGLYALGVTLTYLYHKFGSANSSNSV